MAVGSRSYNPVIDNERCDICAVCIRGCPAEIIPAQRKEGMSLRGRVYQKIHQGIKLTPLLNVDKIFDDSLCQKTCPIHQDIRGYVSLVAGKKYREALELIRETNALPSVTGYVCTHPCERECVRCGVDEPLSVRALKRFVADFDDGNLILRRMEEEKGQKISIIGSGPAGLAAAYDLARKGYSVEILEALSEPGGMLSWAIPPFRLPRNILDRDLNYIKQLGVAITTGVRFGKDVSLSDLKKRGTEAVILAIGTHQGLRMGVENEKDLRGYVDCLTFLRKYSRGEKLDLGDKVIVIGGGYAAIDAARVAVRCGAKEVSIFYRRSYDEMPGKEEVKEGEAEGVSVNYLLAPLRIIEKGGKVQGLEFIRTKLGEPDESGRRRPVPIKGSEFVVSASSVISAVGQQPDLSWNKGNLPFKFSPWNTFIVGDNCATSVEGVFAAGDAVTGPTDIVNAMASGQKAAKAVYEYLSGKGQKK